LRLFQRKKQAAAGQFETTGYCEGRVNRYLDYFFGGILLRVNHISAYLGGAVIK
jgi:hypothetical protein